MNRPGDVDIRIFPEDDEPELLEVGRAGLRQQFPTSMNLACSSS